MRDSKFHRRIERSAIHTGLSTGYDTVDEEGPGCWHSKACQLSLQTFCMKSTYRDPPMEQGKHGDAIRSVAIVGAGWTGRQIAGQMAAFGISVRLIDPHASALVASRDWILAQRSRFCAEGYWPQLDEQTLLARLAFESPSDPLRNQFEAPNWVPDLLLESVPEQASLKRRILKSYSAVLPASTIIASNSSYFTPSTFSSHVEVPERFAHFHFHVPVWKATIVDIASAPQTNQATQDRLIDLAQRIGQTPIVNRVENTGYVFNFLLKGLLQSSLQLLDRGVASPSEIDTAWCKGTGMPVGPFGIMDQIGLDIMQQTMSNARFVDGDDVWGPLLEHIKELVDQGNLGVKTGKGFFEYPDRQLPGG